MVTILFGSSGKSSATYLVSVMSMLVATSFVLTERDERVHVRVLDFDLCFADEGAVFPLVFTRPV